MFARLLASRAPFDPRDPDRFFDTTQVKADLKGKTVRGGAIVVSSQFIRQGLAVVSAIVLARLLSPSETGLVAMVTVFTGFMDLFNDAGLSAATIQRQEVNHKQVSALFWLNIAIGCVLAVVLAGLAPVIAWLNNQPVLIPITLVLATDFIFGSFTIQHQALLRRQMNYAIPAIVGIVSSIVSVSVGIGFALAGFSYWSLVAMRLAPIPIDVIGLWTFCRWRPSRPSWSEGVGSMVRFGGNLTGFRLLNYAGRNLDNFLIGRYFGTGALGLYVKAYGLLLLPLRRVNEPFTAVVMPALSRLQDSPKRYRDAYQNVVSKLCLITMPLVAFMTATADWLVPTLLGERWSAAAPMFAWLGVSGMIEPFAWTTGWLFVSQDRTREQFYWGLISTALTVTAILVGVFGIGNATGVAMAYGISGLLVRTPILFWYVGRSGPVRTRDLYRGLAPFALVTVNILLAVTAYRFFLAGDNALLNLIVGGLITAVVALLTLLALPSGRLALRELKELPDLLLKRKKVASTSA